MTQEDQNTDQTPSDTSTPDAFDTSTGDGDILEELVGPGKKFASVADLAKGKLAADSFIKKTTEENAQLRQVVADLSNKADSSEAINKLVEHLMNAPRASAGNPPPPNEADASNNSQNNQVGLTRADVVALLKQSEREKVAQANRSEANRKLHSMYAEKAPEVVAAKAKELGLSVENLKALAESSPKAFSAMLNLNAEGSSPSASRPGASGRGSVNSAALNRGVPPNSGTRGTKYYEKLKSDMGIRKFVLDSRLQLQMHKDMEALGAEWDNH
jgi:hypothetical protein